MKSGEAYLKEQAIASCLAGELESITQSLDLMVQLLEEQVEPLVGLSHSCRASMRSAEMSCRAVADDLLFMRRSIGGMVMPENS